MSIAERAGPRVAWERAVDVPCPWRVVEHRAETHDVVTLRVEPLSGPAPTFLPAQFSMIGIAGIGEVPISISSSPADRAAHEFTLRRAGAVTNALASVDVGDVVTVRGPFGVPWDLDRSVGRHAVFVGGGIGLAPLRAAIEVTADRARTDGTEVSVLVGAKLPGDVVFAPWLDELANRGVDVRRTVDATEGAQWTGDTGLVTELLARAVTASERVEAFVCGPDVMMSATIHELERLGVRRDRTEVTLERNMQCANGWCGHCQLGSLLICRDGAVVSADRLGDQLERSEL